MESTFSINKSWKTLSIVKSKMAGICFQFIVDINFCTNKCVTKNAVCVLNGQHFFFFFLLFSSKGVNLKKLAR